MPELSQQAKMVSKYLHEQFPLLTFCMYESSHISPLQHHVAYTNTIFVETAREGTETVFHALSDKYRQGRHTTACYEIYPLQGGGFLIDTPGIRGFGIVDIDPEEISNYFPEMLKVSHECRYKPCTHTHEPDCAVIRGVEEGRISYERYSSYLGMLDEEGKYR